MNRIGAENGCGSMVRPVRLEPKGPTAKKKKKPAMTWTLCREQRGVKNMYVKKCASQVQRMEGPFMMGDLGEGTSLGKGNVA